MPGVVLAVVICFLVAALFFLTFFSGFLRRPLVAPRPTASPSPSPANATAGSIFVTSHTRGLDPSAIESLPKFSYSSVKSFNIGNGALDCYVCLNEFEDDETLRLIPACDHVFHIGCIDTWLASNGTCPVCRANLALSRELTYQLREEQSQDQTENGNGNEEVVVHIVTASAQERNAAGPPIRSGSTGKLKEMMERFTLRLPEEVRRKIISGSSGGRLSPEAPEEDYLRKLQRAATWDSSSKAAGGISRRERGGSYKEESRPGRWLSVISISPRLVSGSKSMESESAVAAASGNDGTVDYRIGPINNVR